MSPDVAPAAGWSRRRFGLGAACGVLMPLSSRAHPGAQAPEFREVLPPPLEAALNATRLPRASVGLLVAPVDRKNRVPVVSLNADLPFQMASTTKVVTSLAALDLLGPSFRWRTRAYLSGSLHEGRLLGDLIILGGGDARLSVEALRAWFVQLQASGLREVWGDVVIDRFAFRLSDGDHASTPLPAPERPHHARPDAMVLNEGVMRVSVQGSAQRRLDVSLVPGLSGLRVVNQLTQGKQCSAAARLDQAEPGDSRLVVSGQWSAACGEREVAQIALPHGEFTTRAVSALWQDSGGKLKGRVRDMRVTDADLSLLRSVTGLAPLPWATLESEALAALLRDMNKTSDNLMARHLMLSLTPGFPELPATLPAARRRVRDWLTTQGIEVGDIDVDNGSGLSRSERAKPRAMVQLLRNAWNGRHVRPFVDSLPIAGVDGTLAGRMMDGPATGRAFLKTGTLSDTRALAGYVKGRSDRMYAVAAFVNDPDIAPAQAGLDAVIEWTAANG